MAERSGPDFPTVLAQPFAVTLYAYQCLTERDRIARLRARDDDVTRGILMALAFAEPGKLDRERAEIRAEMRRSASGPTLRAQNDELRTLGLALAERIERGRVLEDKVS